MIKETITRYLAKDGKEFKENEGLECAWYELMLEGKDNIHFYNENQEPVELTPENFLFEHKLTMEVVYVKFDTDEMAQAYSEFLTQFKEITGNYIGTFDYFIPTEGLYFYDEDAEYWRSWKDEVEWLEAMGRTFQVFKDKPEELPLSFEEVLGEE